MTAMSNEQALEPCPFCGSGPARGFGRFTSASFSGVEIMDPTNQPYVWCGTCCARTLSCDSQAEAIAAWNARPSPARDKVLEEAPAGDFVMVPREPTEDMLAAMCRAEDDGLKRDEWIAAVAAAPKPTQPIGLEEREAAIEVLDLLIDARLEEDRGWSITQLTHKVLPRARALHDRLTGKDR